MAAITVAAPRPYGRSTSSVVAFVVAMNRVDVVDLVVDLVDVNTDIDLVDVDLDVAHLVDVDLVDILFESCLSHTSSSRSPLTSAFYSIFQH